MAQPYVGEIRMFAGNFAPAGWELCAGQLLSISEYETLFNLIGTTYGGDGQSTFAVPDLRGRAPLHQGNGIILAETGGVEEVTLTINQIPAHTHLLLANSSLTGRSSTPVNNVFTTLPRFYTSATPQAQTPPPGSTGGSQPHNNMQPYLVINYIISLFGIFPSPT